ncbi:MAG TPA: 50S ribosomal protein L30 [Bacteroidia bacterium]|jgi:large subunit ribosomal protein L30
MAKIKVKLVKSGIGQTVRQKNTLKALGLRKLHQTVEKEGTPQVLGMIAKVQHLLEVVK